MYVGCSAHFDDVRIERLPAYLCTSGVLRGLCFPLSNTHTMHVLNMEVISDWPIPFALLAFNHACTSTILVLWPLLLCTLSFKNTERSYKGMFAYEVDIVQLNEQVSKLRENVEGRTSSEIRELKRKIQEVGERVGSIASRMDQEERVQELEKRVKEQDQMIASLTDKLERVLVTLGLEHSDT